ncbi:MAG: TDT family transporter, partial [Promethearchaeota archaeon]
MKRVSFAKVPAPLAGLGLGLACLGSVILNYNFMLGNILGVLAALVLGIYLLKIVMNFSAFMQDLKHPLFSSIVPTFSMGMMIIATYLGRINYETGRIIWLVAVVLHGLLLIIFLSNFLRDFNFQNVVPSYFIPPVGIVVACITGGMFNFPILCETIFYFGFISYIITLILVVIRLAIGNIPNPKKATLAILAAPASLCLAGYLSLNSVLNPIFIYILIPLSIAMTVSVYVMFLKLLRMPFNPGYSAYTFPLAISAVAML